MADGPESAVPATEPSATDAIVARLRTVRRIQRAQTADRVLRIVFAVLVAVEVVFLGFHVYERWDLTLTGAFTIAPRTVRILSELDEPVKVSVFYSNKYPPHQWAFERVRDLLEAYGRASDNVVVEFVDPYAKRERADLLRKKFSISEMDFASGVVVFAYKEQAKFVTDSQIVVRKPSPGMAGPGQPQAFRGEEAFLSAILSLVEGKKPLAYILTGHLEASADDTSAVGFAQAVERLRRDNYDVRKLALKSNAAVPEDCEVLVVPGPQSPFSKVEAYALRNYLDRGGRVLLLLQPVLEKKTLRVLDIGLDPLLEYFGLAPVDSLLIDLDSPAHPSLLLRLQVTDYSRDHPVTLPLLGAGENKAVVMPFSRPLRLAKKTPEGTKVEVLAWTGPRAVRKANPEEIVDQTKFEGLVKRFGLPVRADQDEVGRFPLAVAAEKSSARHDRQGRMVVVGCYLCASNGILVTEPWNEDFLLNAVNWLTEREQHLGIAEKKPREVTYRIKPRKMTRIFWLTVVIMPLTVLAFGVAVWTLRRK